MIQSSFLTEITKRSQWHFFFLPFRTHMRVKKINFNLKSVIVIGSRTIPLWTIAPRTIPTQENCHLGNSPGQFARRAIKLPPRIITPGQLLPRAMAITNYNFLWLFSVSFPWPNYIIFVFCCDNKNNDDNSNKTWSLKLLSVIIL